ncbi:MAG: hypothetical protein PHG06_15240 [Parabacteroides sp.]|nr:hypothetical protein [Parabacteroides sp.]
MANTLNNILKVADKVIKTPSITLQSACSEFGINLLPGTSILVGAIIAPSPILFLGMWVAGKIAKNRRESQEKERMKNEIIRKQQAIINKLKRENELNKQEIKNLKDTLSMLEDVLSKLEAA